MMISKVQRQSAIGVLYGRLERRTLHNGWTVCPQISNSQELSEHALPGHFMDTAVAHVNVSRNAKDDLKVASKVNADNAKMTQNQRCLQGNMSTSSLNYGIADETWWTLGGPQTKLVRGSDKVHHRLPVVQFALLFVLDLSSPERQSLSDRVMLTSGTHFRMPAFKLPAVREEISKWETSKKSKDGN
jgi:hypothetical protein